MFRRLLNWNRLRSAIIVIFVFVGIATLVFASDSISAKKTQLIAKTTIGGKNMSLAQKETLARSNIPPIDARKHANVETATFGLG